MDLLEGSALEGLEQINTNFRNSQTLSEIYSDVLYLTNALAVLQEGKKINELAIIESELKNLTMGLCYAKEAKKEADSKIADLKEDIEKYSKAIETSKSIESLKKERFEIENSDPKSNHMILDLVRSKETSIKIKEIELEVKEADLKKTILLITKLDPDPKTQSLENLEKVKASYERQLKIWCDQLAKAELGISNLEAQIADYTKKKQNLPELIRVENNTKRAELNNEIERLQSERQTAIQEQLVMGIKAIATQTGDFIKKIFNEAGED